MIICYNRLMNYYEVVYIRMKRPYNEFNIGSAPSYYKNFDSSFQLRSCQVSDLILEDVALRAAVLRSTASRVINDRPNLSENARRCVSKVIQWTGCRPTPQAVRLPLSTIKVTLVS